MIEIGRLCVKLAGRDAGNDCVIVDVLDDNYVLIDGNVRRRKCNILHLEPTPKKIEIAKNASHEAVAEEFSKLKLGVWESRPKQAGTKPAKVKAKKEVKEEPAPKKGKKKSEKKPIDARVVSVTDKAVEK